MKFVPATPEETLIAYQYHSEALRYFLSQQPDQTITFDDETWNKIPQKVIRADTNDEVLKFSLVDVNPERREGVTYIAFPELSDIINETLGQENAD